MLAHLKSTYKTSVELKNVLASGIAAFLLIYPPQCFQNGFEVKLGNCLGLVVTVRNRNGGCLFLL